MPALGPGALQGGSGVLSRACSRCYSPLSLHKLHSQMYHSWGEALPPPHPPPLDHFHGGTGSAPEWKQCSRSWRGKNVHREWHGQLLEMGQIPKSYHNPW